MKRPRDLVALLCSGQLRVATGLWLLPDEFVGKEDEEAYRLDLEPVDLRQRLLDALEPGTKYAGLSVDRLVTLIDGVTRERADRAGALIYNLDLLLARLTSADRQLVWDDLFKALPRRSRAILLTMPEAAEDLLPWREKLDLWRLDNRLCGTIEE